MEVSGQLRARPLYPRARALGTHWTGGRVGLRVGLDAVGKRKIPSPRQGLHKIRKNQFISKKFLIQITRIKLLFFPYDLRDKYWGGRIKFSQKTVTNELIRHKQLENFEKQSVGFTLNNVQAELNRPLNTRPDWTQKHFPVVCCWEKAP
jgi:hypothetical protein